MTQAPRPAAAATVLTVLMAASLAAAPAPARAVPAPHVRPFDLRDVRLLDGPFRDAMLRDRDYLLGLEPDRLLHMFRVTAGLPAPAQPYGHWEAAGCELRGHFVGHYLSACAMMFASTGDGRLKERADLMVRELAHCQQALGAGGYLSAFPENFFDRLESTGKVWAPYYTLHKILAGLLDVHRHCGNQQSLDVAKRFGDWVVARNQRLTDEQVQRVLAVEHGGIQEAMLDLYAAGGVEAHLTAARRLTHEAVTGPLAACQDNLAGLHANTQFPKILGAARLYEITGDERQRTIAGFFWARVVNHHSYVIGGNSDHEHFGPPDQLADRLSPWTAETCNTHNMLKLTKHLFAWSPSAAQGDFHERALFNQILATQDPRTGMMAYHVPMSGAWFMPYNTPDDSFWCCTGTGVESHAKHADAVYWHDNTSLLVNQFLASEVSWPDKGLTLRQETRFPAEESSRLTLRCAKPVQLSLKIRWPAWAGEFVATVNGEAVQVTGSPGSFVSLPRSWHDGDTVVIRLPMSLRLETMPDSPAKAAICYGPVVLAGALGSDGIVPPMPYARGQSDFFQGQSAPPAPVLLGKDRPLHEWIEPVPGKPLTFRTKGVGQPHDVTLVAFHALPPQRYSIYWDLLTPEDWRNREQEIATQARLAQELDERTVDRVHVGEFEPERAHQLKGENMATGTFSGRLWRHAADGWFSWELKVLKDQAQELCVTYWGDDRGLRTFDIFLDDQKLATQSLDGKHPGRFFDAVYQIPASLTHGKDRVTVKFHAHPGHTAGGVFGVRVLKPMPR